MMKKLIAFAILLLSCFPFCRADWVFFDSTSDGETCFMADKVSDLDYRGYVQVWVKIEYAKPQYYNKKRYDYEKGLWLFDSKLLKFAVISLSYYKKNGSIVYSWDDKYAPYSPDWQYIIPESIASDAADMVRAVKSKGFLKCIIEDGAANTKEEYTITYQK